jgi:hypothetical protein
VGRKPRVGSIPTFGIPLRCGLKSRAPSVDTWLLSATAKGHRATKEEV